MHIQALTTLVVLTLGFFSQANAGVIARQEDAGSDNLVVPGDDAVDQLAQTALDYLSAHLEEVESTASESEKRSFYGGGRCTLGNVSIRREW